LRNLSRQRKRSGYPSKKGRTKISFGKPRR
jgi:hypothetical protein